MILHIEGSKVVILLLFKYKVSKESKLEMLEGMLYIFLSDRITTTVNELSKLGANIQELPDGLLIEGTGYLSVGNCSSNGDHRLAMTLAIAGTLANETVNISESEAVSVSYPNFWNDLSMIMNS